MPIDTPKYDVAISFLSKDEAIAAALHDKLSEGLEVFFYPRKQEELAGTDGMESMRTPFLEDCRVIVVLYRVPWGKTPWTRVEQTAIQDSCLNHGWHRLFFVMLDDSRPPIWLPQTHVRFNFSNFGLEQAVGAIKARVQEQGGVVSPLTAVRRAALYEREAQHIQERRALLVSYTGMQTVRQEVSMVFSEIERLCAEIPTMKNLHIRVGANPGRCVVTNDRISLVVGWAQQFGNTTEGSALKVLEYNARLALPNERIMFLFEPTILRTIEYLPELSLAGECGWVQKGKPVEFFSSSALADRCIRQFFDLAARDDRGEIKHPFT